MVTAGVDTEPLVHVNVLAVCQLLLLNQATAVDCSEPCSYSTLFALVALCAEEVSRLPILQYLPLLLASRAVSP
jgi:hypothetical protein